jgi:hypothetical protein
MPRPPVKSTEKLAFAGETGRLKAQQKMHQKKPIEESLREHIGKMIDRIDPLETAAVLVGTVIIHDVILGTETLIKKFNSNPALTTAANIALTGILPALGIFQIFMQPFYTAAAIKEVPDLSKLPANELLIWAISFMASFLMVRSAQKISAASVLPTITSVLGMVGLA